jgi:FkbM family methyltransferase
MAELHRAHFGGWMRRIQMVLRLSLRHFPVFTRKFLTNTVRISVGDREVAIPVADDAGVRIVYWEKSWKTDVIKRLAALNPGTFLDVGANVGETLLDFRSAHPTTEYVGFEPSSACVKYLRELIDVNDFMNSSIVPVGLAEKASIFALHTHSGVGYDGTATMLPTLRPGRKLDAFHVPVYPLDEIREGLGIHEISFIKIDVEGAELEAITGMQKCLREFTPVILCEVLFTDPKGNLAAAKERNARLMRLLTEMDYAVWQLQKDSANSRVTDVVEISEFASDYYSAKTKDLCDYLFVPKAAQARVRNALLT